MIQGLGRLLVDVADSRIDFVGHIGGDDFFIIFQSRDWEMRCWQLVRGFAEAMNGRIGAIRHKDGATFYVELQASQQLSLL